jgi:hypothetical protein
VPESLLSVVNDWIVTTLEAYAPLTALVPVARIGVDDTVTAPEGQPYVTVEHAAGPDDVWVISSDNTRILGEHLYQVTARARTGTWATVAPAHEQIRAALHNKSATVSGVYIARAVCEREDQLPELIEGVRYRARWWMVRVEAHVA